MHKFLITEKMPWQDTPTPTKRRKSCAESRNCLIDAARDHKILYTLVQAMEKISTQATSIIICADDFAITPEVSEGIVSLAEKSRISATSVMSLSPHWAGTASLLRAVKNKIDVGLHFDLTSHFPHALGAGNSLGKLMLKSYLGQVSFAQISSELHRQLDLFESHFGQAPDHIDGHQHVQQFPVIQEALVKVMVDRYAGSQMPWLRVSRIPSSQLNFKALIINAMGANSLSRLASENQIPQSAYLTGVYEFKGNEQTFMQLLDRCLTNVPPNTVLMCHPGLPGSHEVIDYAARLWEQNVLASDFMVDLLHLRGLSLARGSQSLKKQLA